MAKFPQSDIYDPGLPSLYTTVPQLEPDCLADVFYRALMAMGRHVSIERGGQREARYVIRADDVSPAIAEIHLRAGGLVPCTWTFYTDLDANPEELALVREAARRLQVQCQLAVDTGDCPKRGGQKRTRDRGPNTDTKVVEYVVERYREYRRQNHGKIAAARLAQGDAVDRFDFFDGVSEVTVYREWNKKYVRDKDYIE